MITITDAAATKIKEVLAKEAKQDYVLRMKAEGGGCCGPRYVVALEENPQASDQVVETKGIKVVIDPQSAPVLQDVEFDYTEGLIGGGFQIKNPNLKSSCGCR